MSDTVAVETGVERTVNVVSVYDSIQLTTVIPRRGDQDLSVGLHCNLSLTAKPRPATYV